MDESLPRADIYSGPELIWECEVNYNQMLMNTECHVVNIGLFGSCCLYVRLYVLSLFVKAG